ncbi:hypothetical protein [Jannaschia formosa]|uniref:hypothetical protein n=1 Tax=Jannaschia formosa TaxID=2259592 RepID=UPI0010753F67|nr:hypothetical protein [Jannaschia formosa]TFL19278.1 hypothetical protein DR046_04955 [Jannaschia formosa]
MADRTDRSVMAERMAAIATIIGTGGVIAGLGLVGLAVLTGGLPGLPEAGWLVGLAPGLVVALLGLGLVMRGVHLNATLDTLASIRLLQEETHRARTQAAVYSHAMREPMPPLRATAQMEAAKPVAMPAAKPAVMPAAKPAPAMAAAGADAGTAAGSPRVAQMTPPLKREPVQSTQRASKATPIKGKPFQPHPIFMARPPR